MQPSLSQANRAQVNRANAQHSTGPKTEQGKKHASLNAMRHGLTGQILVLPAEELAKFKTHCQNFRDRYKPQTPDEEELVQLLADTRWRIMRVPTIENNIQMLGASKRRRYTGTEDDDLRLALATAAEVRDQTKVLTNLALYEQRLWRQYDKILHRLEEAQTQRKESHPIEKWLRFFNHRRRRAEPLLGSRISRSGRPMRSLGAPNQRPSASICG